MKRITTLLFAAVFLAVSAYSAFAAEKLVVYTSMKESIIGSLKEAFVKKYPDDLNFSVIVNIKTTVNFKIS